jgi:hypothetical protein
LFALSISTEDSFGKLHLSKKLFTSSLWVFKFICPELCKIHCHFPPSGRDGQVYHDKMEMGLWGPGCW